MMRRGYVQLTTRSAAALLVLLGPLAFEVGVAKDAAATESDVVVEMRFVGGDWRVVGVKPRI